MGESIIVADSNLQEGRKLCAMLKRHRYSATSLDSLEGLLTAVGARACRCVILDLDRLSIDNRFIRNLLQENPGLCVIGTSARTFHPDLEEAMRSHIFACLSKPVDEEELIYWLKSVCEKESLRASPPEK